MVRKSLTLRLSSGNISVYSDEDTDGKMEDKKMYRMTQYRVSLVKDSAEMKEGTRRIDSVQAIAEACADMKALDREQLRVYYINARMGLIGWELISQGTLTASLAHPREIFKGAILATCHGIILAHNHPSGEPSPSEEDVRLTKRVAQCGQILGIRVLDHVIIAENGTYSFKASGQL